MKEQYILYHGSNKIIETPQFGVGNPHNDYGMAFYCTESIEMASEWAVSERQNGFVNKYVLNTSGLSELNLGCGAYHILNWLAILLENRIFRVDSELKKMGKEYILQHFGIAYQAYDVIRGYRADDSYFSFANAFLNNGMSLKQLEKAMYLGKMGEQIAIRSEKAFGQLGFLEAIEIDCAVYYPSRKRRDENARKQFACEKANPLQGIYLLDIMRESWENEDERIQRIIFGGCN